MTNLKKSRSGDDLRNSALYCLKGRNGDILRGINSVYSYEVDIISGTSVHGTSIVHTLSSIFSSGLSHEGTVRPKAATFFLSNRNGKIARIMDVGSSLKRIESPSRRKLRFQVGCAPRSSDSGWYDGVYRYGCPVMCDPLLDNPWVCSSWFNDETGDIVEVARSKP